MNNQGWYYLHVNGSLIYKPSDDAAMDIRDSDLARCMWPMDTTDRAGAWNILVEGLALGANPDRVHELAEKWHCDDEDADHYAQYMNIRLDRDGNMWCATPPGFTNPQESDAGFGATKLEAMADLAKTMKVPAGKMWRTTFKDMLTTGATKS